MAGVRHKPRKIDDPDVTNKILTAIAKGAPNTIACNYAGISNNTLLVWLKKGRAVAELPNEEIEKHDDLIYYNFLCKIKEVRAAACCKWLEKIDEAANIHWQAAAWKLERLYPEYFAKKETSIIKFDDKEKVKEAKEIVEKLKLSKNGRSYAA